MKRSPAEGAGGQESGAATGAFDALYARCAPSLFHQTFLLTGRRGLSREAVARAFALAWERWPEVAVDPDPAGWVRAAAYEYALSPWHRLRRAHRAFDPPPAEPGARALLDALLELPPPYRRTLLLHDGVGLGLPETAAETEASTRATANRLMNARAALAERLPELALPSSPVERSALLRERIGMLARSAPTPEVPAQAAPGRKAPMRDGPGRDVPVQGAPGRDAPVQGVPGLHVPPWYGVARRGRVDPFAALPSPEAIRTGSERRARRWTRAVFSSTALLVGLTLFSLVTGPDGHGHPENPDHQVEEEPLPGHPQRPDPPQPKPGRQPVTHPGKQPVARPGDGLVRGTARLAPRAGWARPPRSSA